MMESGAVPEQKYERRWGEPRYLAIGHAFTKDGVRVDVVRPYSWVKAIHRHNEWMKKKNNELLKGVSDEV